LATPPKVKLFIVPWLAAGMRSGNACASAPSTTSTMRWLVSMLPTATAAGKSGLSKLCGGTMTVTGWKQPWLTGMSSCASKRTQYQVAERTTDSTAFRLPATCGALPLKSTVICEPDTVIFTQMGIRTSRCPSPSSASSKR